MKKKAIDITKCYVDGPYEIDYAQELFICRSRDYPCPLGMVWGQGNWNNKKEWTYFEVNGSYVLEWARRCGVRSLINEEILKKYKAVTSRDGTKDGKPFMKKSGYKADPFLGYVLK